MRDRGRQLDTESGGRKMDCSRLNNNSRERVEQSPMRPKHYHRRLCGGATAAPRKEQRPVHARVLCVRVHLCGETASKDRDEALKIDRCGETSIL